jgi:urease accessory protein
VTSRVTIAAAAAGSGTVLEELAGTEPWRPRILGDGRVALVQSRASIVRGDAVDLCVHVGEGATLELVELGATLTHDARGGAAAAISVEVVVGDGASLTWLAAPVVVARGAAVERTARIELTGSARVLLGESVVLGRAREPCGALTTRTRILRDGRPVLDETLDTGDAGSLRSAVVAGAAGVIAGLTLAGVRDADPPPGAMQAHGEATLWRAAGGAVEVARSAGVVAERWRGVLGERVQLMLPRVAAH